MCILRDFQRVGVCAHFLVQPTLQLRLSNVDISCVEGSGLTWDVTAVHRTPGSDGFQT